MPPLAAVAQSPQIPLRIRFFSSNVNLSLRSNAGLNTRCGVLVGADLNLLWLGPKMIIFGVGLVVPCGYRGRRDNNPHRHANMG